MNNQKLDEVRRTLRQLQQIATEPIDDIDPAERGSAGAVKPASSWGRLIGNVFISAKRILEKGSGATTGLAGQRMAVMGLAAVLAVGMAGWAFVGTDEDAVPAMGTATSSIIEPERRTGGAEPVMEAAVSEAQQLINAGKIIEARRSLIDLEDKSPEAALTLARSYDPNYLRLIADADAAADPKEAERWYRAWRDIAAKKGLVLETDRLDRIINAMY